MTTTAPPVAAPTAAVSVRQWLPGLAALGLIWGSSFLFIKVGVSALPPAYVALGRVLSGAVVLVAFLAIIRDRLPRELNLWAHNAVVAVLGIAVPFSLFAYAETQISSVLAGIWNAVTPLIVLPMAVAVFRTEKLTTRRVLGLTLGLVGALIILGIWRGVGGASLSGQLLCLAAAACYGVAIPYTKRFIAPRPESGAVMSACQLLVATGVLLIAAPLLSRGLPDPTAWSWPVIGFGGRARCGRHRSGLRDQHAQHPAGRGDYGFDGDVRGAGLRHPAGGAGAAGKSRVVPAGRRARRAPGRGGLARSVVPSPGAEANGGAPTSAVLRRIGGRTNVKETELWQRLEAQLGRGYAQVWAAEHHVADLNGQTVRDALHDGTAAKQIWRAVWRELELPDRER